MTADQNCLLLPQIYFVNQSLRAGEREGRTGTFNSKSFGILERQGPLIQEVLSDCLRQTPADRLIGDRRRHRHSLRSYSGE